MKRIKLKTAPVLIKLARTTLILLIPTAIVVGQINDDSLSFQEAIIAVFSTDNNLMAARENHKAAESGIREAKASYMPALALTGSYYYISKVGEISIPVPGINQNIKVGSNTPFDVRFGLNYELYTFGRRPASVQIARTETRRSQLQYQHNRKNLFDAVGRAYFAVAFTTQSLTLVQDEKNRFEQIYQLVESRFEQDLVTEFDLLQTQLRLETYKLSLLEISNNIRLAQLNLAKLLGITEDQLPVLSDSLARDILQVPEITSHDVLYHNREDYIEANLRVQKAQLARKINRSAYFPSLTAFGAYGWRNGYPTDVDRIEDGFSFGVNLNWLLFDGFARRAKTSKQDYIIKANKYLIEDLKAEIPRQVNNVQLMLENSQSRIDVGTQALLVAQKSMAIARTRFEIGDLTMIELLEIENKLSEVELDLLKLEYQYILAQLDYKQACGFYPEIDNLD